MIHTVEEARAVSGQLISWRRDLHRFPETDLRLPRTKAYVTRVLQELGVSFREYETHDGITAVIGRPGGRVIGIRGDMDGLPVREETGLPYASENDCMHACGHDGHTAVLLGLAKILKEHEAELPGQVKLIFQPGEENLIGAKAMVAEGALKDPAVDRLYTMHLGSIGGIARTGDILVNRSNVFLASECTDILVYGRGGHAASPHKAVDPVPIAAEIITALQTIISRELQPGTVALISVTSVETPTHTYNIIPDHVRLWTGIRAKETRVQEFLFRRAEELAKGIAESHGGRAEFRRVSGAPAVVNDAEAVAQFLSSAGKLLPEERIHVIDTVNMGADDAAYFLQEVPGCYFYFCNALPWDDGVIYPHHNAKFMMDDSVLYQAAALLLQAALDDLGAPSEGEGL